MHSCTPVQIEGASIPPAVPSAPTATPRCPAQLPWPAGFSLVEFHVSYTAGGLSCVWLAQSVPLLLLLNSISLWVTLQFVYCWIIFSLRFFWIKLQWTSAYKSSCSVIFSPAVWTDGNFIFYFIKRPPDCFPRWLYLQCFLSEIKPSFPQRKSQMRYHQ